MKIFTILQKKKALFSGLALSAMVAGGLTASAGWDEASRKETGQQEKNYLPSHENVTILPEQTNTQQEQNQPVENPPAKNQKVINEPVVNPPVVKQPVTSPPAVASRSGGPNPGGHSVSQQTKPVQKTPPPSQSTKSSSVAAGKTLTMTATAYGPGNINWKYGGKTYTGTQVREGVVAVDPKVIPLGTRVWVSGYKHPNLPAKGFMAVAEDTGGAIRGNRIDIFIDTDHQSLRNFGRQNVKIRILGN